MTTFFIRTDASVSGPFTGVELREAALAGILGPETSVAGSPQGPWYAATNVGLFSDKRMALPHPPDVQVPQYHVRGMSGAFQGPFKLRELIGLAARGMLPAEALLQSAVDQPWISVDRIRVLSACLHGELALIDSRGQIIRRAVQSPAKPVDVATARAPIEVARPADQSDATAFAPTVQGDAEPQPKAAKKRAVQAVDLTDSDLPPSRIHRLLAWRQHLPEDFSDRLITLSLRLAPALVVMLLLVAAAYGYTYWQDLPMHRDQVIGEWIGVMNNSEGNEESSFGIAFRNNGTCVIFDPARQSWSGDFVWVERHDDSIGFQNFDPFTSTVDSAEPNHSPEIVRPSDGYLRLTGHATDPPFLDGHPVVDLFVRREEGMLRLGYLTTVRCDRDHKTMEAAWLTVTQSIRSDGERKAALPITSSSPSVELTELLATYGIPDEARKIYPFELPSHRDAKLLSDAQVIRYGATKLLLTADGHLQTPNPMP